MIDPVVPSLRALLFLAIESRAAGEIHLTTNDGFDVVRPRLLVELDRAKEIAMIGLGHRRHVGGFSAFKERVVFDRTIEQ